MERHVHEAALRAAAQLALTLGAVGCGNPEPVAAPAPPTADECLRVIDTADASMQTSLRFVGCCVHLALIDRSTQTQGGRNLSAKQRYDCCEVLQWDGSLGCTPWGPPAPPAFAA